VGQDLPGLDVRDGSLHDVTDSAQGLVRLFLGLGELAVGRLLTGGDNPGSDVAFVVGAAGGVDLLEHAGGGCGNLGVDLVGGDLQERFVDLDGLADPFEPRGDGAAGD